MTLQEALNVLSNTKFSVSNEAEEQKCRVYQAAFKTAIEALEKQIPKKPYLEGDGYDDNGYLIYDTGFCPNCNHEFEVDYEATKCCPDCGQALDWSDTE